MTRTGLRSELAGDGVRRELRRAAPAPPAVRIAGVSKTFGEVVALDDVSLEVAAASTVALVGANGAGKSTLLALIAGLIPATAGSATVAGRPVSCGRETAPLVGALTHETMLYDRLTGRENLALHARLRGVPTGRIDRVLSQVDLVEAADRPVAGYSHGMRKRLCLARVLLHDPSVLLLDEPFAGLDTAGQLALSQLLDDVRGTRTVIFTTHDADMVVEHADRVVTLDHGRIASSTCHRSDASPVTPEPLGAPAGLLRTAWAMFRKDVAIEVRTRATWSAVLMLAGLLATILAMAFEPLAGNPRAVSGILWVLVVFTAMHGLVRSFDEDLRNDALRGLLVTGANPAGLYLGRVASVAVSLFAVTLVAVTVVAVLFATPSLFAVLPGLAVLVGLAVLGLAAVGTILTIISRCSPLGETLLPLLLLPLAVPVLLAGVESVAILLDVGVVDPGWMRVLLFYAVGMLAASAAVFEYSMEG